MRKLIGRGMFTRAYQIGPELVEIVTTCQVKECYAEFSQGNRFAPVIEKLDYLDSGESVYHMPLYPKIKAPKRQLNSRAYHIYKQLRKISYNSDYDNIYNLIEGLDLTSEEKEEIQSLLGDAANVDCQSIAFEISPRNISATKDGDLVMLDCFFDRKAAIKIYKNKSSNINYWSF